MKIVSFFLNHRKETKQLCFNGWFFVYTASLLLKLQKWKSPHPYLPPLAVKPDLCWTEDNLSNKETINHPEIITNWRYVEYWSVTIILPWTIMNKHLNLKKEIKTAKAGMNKKGNKYPQIKKVMILVQWIKKSVLIIYLTLKHEDWVYLLQKDI